TLSTPADEDTWPSSAAASVIACSPYHSAGAALPESICEVLTDASSVAAAVSVEEVLPALPPQPVERTSRAAIIAARIPYRFIIFIPPLPFEHRTNSGFFRKLLTHFIQGAVQGLLQPFLQGFKPEFRGEESVIYPADHTIQLCFIIQF